MEGYLYDQGDEIIVRKSKAGGVFAHIGTELIDVGEYRAYPVDATYRELTENVSAVHTVYSGDDQILYPSSFTEEDTNWEGYPFMVVVSGGGLTMALNGESADSPLYCFYTI